MWQCNHISCDVCVCEHCRLVCLQLLDHLNVIVFLHGDNYSIMCVSMCTYMCIDVCVCIDMGIDVYCHVCHHMHTYIHIYIYIYIYIGKTISPL